MKSLFKISLFAFFFLLLTQVFGQYADCENLLILKDTLYHTKAITGFGNKKEFDKNNLTDKKKFKEEENSIWYLITIPESGVFTFDIVTENKNNDWDFLLYPYKTMFCEIIEDKVIMPLRTNLSRSSITGLSKKATESFVGAGVNNNSSKAVYVKKGDKFILVVNNPKRSGGKHTLILHFPKKKKEEKEIKVQQPSNTTLFNVEFKDAITKKSILGSANISGLKKSGITLDTVTSYAYTISKKNRQVTIDAYAKGYMLISKEYKISKTKSKYMVEVLLAKIEPGKRVNLTKIQFYGDQFNLLPSAKPSLKTLLLFMQNNPSVTIEVEGHVNGPGERNSKSYKELSYNRAFAVKTYLVKNGIIENRIAFKGYGNSKMLYPTPKNLLQESANRRVEIKILSK